MNHNHIPKLKLFRRHRIALKVSFIGFVLVILTSCTLSTKLDLHTKSDTQHTVLAANMKATKKALRKKINNQTKPIIYQVFPRLFGNQNSHNKPWGTIEENFGKCKGKNFCMLYTGIE